MDGNISILLSSGMWIMSASMGLAILLLAYGVLHYCKRRIAQVTGDTADCAALAAQKERLAADVHTLEDWIAKHRDDLLKMEAERKKQEEIRLELEGLQDGLAGLRHEQNELESQKEILHSVVHSLRHEQAQHEQRNHELTALQNELVRVQNEIQQGNAQLAACADAEIKHSRFITQQTILEEQIMQSVSKKEALEKYIQENEKTAEKHRIKLQYYEEREEHHKKLEASMAGLKANIANLESRRSVLNGEIYKFEEAMSKRMAVESDIENRKQLLAEVQKTHDELRHAVYALEENKKSLIMACEKSQKDTELLNTKYEHTLDDMQVRQSALRQLVEKRNEQDAQIQKMDVALRGKEAEFAVLEEKIRDQRNALGLTAEEPEEAYADLVDVRPECLNGLDHARTKKLHEADMLENLCAALERKGEYFSRRVINAFHTSLKCQTVNPLTVLAGVSGTGKTLLPNRYAEFMGIHKLVMAVQPRWDSPQDLFGFYNYLEKKYKAKDLARLLVHMDPYNEHALKHRREDMQDRLALVLLDEMNLARTEYYFSEFLSRLELRQLVDADKRHAAASRSSAELELDTGPGIARRIWVPENVFFVGTMNEDESTQTLSDKVLDRSNVLRFGKPAAPAEINGNGKTAEMEIGAYLSAKTWKSWYHAPDVGSPVHKEVTGWINALNDAMDTIGRPFGFRVQNAMQTYVANYPDMGRDNRHKLAFADQIEQKILPKLRGLDTDGQGQVVLQKVKEVIEAMGDEELYDTFDTALRDTSAGMFQWRGVTRAVSAES